MTKNIIITGGAGFIGYHLSEKLLKKNFKIIIIDNLSRGKYDNALKKLLKNKNIKFIRFDLTMIIGSCCICWEIAYIR